MMKVFFGIAGIPLTCKGRTLKDSIDDIHALDLDAMEAQLLRFPIFQNENLEELGILARELNVTLSVHTPYYMDLFGHSVARERSLENIKRSLEVASRLNAGTVIAHMGLYNDFSPSKAMNQAIDDGNDLIAYIKDEGYNCRLGFETSGREKVFGSLEEILTLVEEVPQLMPVINFGHIHAREMGILRKKEAYQSIFDETIAVTGEQHFYTHFSGVEHKNGNKLMDTPIKKSDIKFEPLAECILDNPDYDITVISTSPLLEHDAQYMKLILERITMRRDAKEKRRKAKEEKKEAAEGNGEKEKTEEKGEEGKKETEKVKEEKKDKKDKKEKKAEGGKKKGGVKKKGKKK